MGQGSSRSPAWFTELYRYDVSAVCGPRRWSADERRLRKSVCLADGGKGRHASTGRAARISAPARSRYRTPAALSPAGVSTSPSSVVRRESRVSSETGRGAGGARLPRPRPPDHTRTSGSAQRQRIRSQHPRPKYQDRAYAAFGIGYTSLLHFLFLPGHGPHTPHRSRSPGRAGPGAGTRATRGKRPTNAKKCYLASIGFI